jgi:chemotaxis protein methyltransferase CheR
MQGSVAFDQYSAKDLRRGKGSLLGKVYRFLRSEVLYGHVLYPYGVFRHALLLATCDRTQSHTYTCFYRTPSQLSALAGPVLKFLNAASLGRPLEILVLACSNGAEAYTIASVLKQRVPTLDFRITAADLHQEMADYGRAASYRPEEALQSEYIDADFVARTFDRVGERYVVKPEIRQHVTFQQANLLDETLATRLPQADIVTAQNVLFHLSPANARSAFNNIVKLLRPRSALLIDGMDQPLRVALTREQGLQPLPDKAKAIYRESRIHTPEDWWHYYWGSEPYSLLRRDRARRYGTIFLKGSND